MRWLIKTSAVAAALILSTSTAAVAGNGAVRGEAEDSGNPGLGTITYVFNNAGYHFWFTPTENVSIYQAGHSYHNIYKYDAGGQSAWCGPVSIPDTPPYNAGGTAGGKAYYRVLDLTTGQKVDCS